MNTRLEGYQDAVRDGVAVINMQLRNSPPGTFDPATLHATKAMLQALAAIESVWERQDEEERQAKQLLTGQEP